MEICTVSNEYSVHNREKSAQKLAIQFAQFKRKKTSTEKGSVFFSTGALCDYESLCYMSFKRDSMCNESNRLLV